MTTSMSRFLCILAGVFYPAYASFKALENPETNENKQWLTYWTIYACSTSLETLSAKFASWVPGYYIVKAMVLLWLMLPKTKVKHYSLELLSTILSVACDIGSHFDV